MSPPTPVQLEAISPETRTSQQPLSGSGRLSSPAPSAAPHHSFPCPFAFSYPSLLTPATRCPFRSKEPKSHPSFSSSPAERTATEGKDTTAPASQQRVLAFPQQTASCWGFPSQDRLPLVGKRMVQPVCVLGMAAASFPPWEEDQSAPTNLCAAMQQHFRIT